MNDEIPFKRMRIDNNPVEQEAESLADFFRNPEGLRPKSEHLNAAYAEDDTALTHAVKTNNRSAVLKLLALGADPNIQNSRGITPLSAAAHNGRIDIIVDLVNYGASVNNQNASGSTPLIQASHFGHVDAVRVLLENGSEADYTNSKGTTALMRACQEGHDVITELLISYHCNVNRKNNEGMNALMLASQRGHDIVVTRLIRAGASMDEQTPQGSTALMLACKRGHTRVVETLVTMGAEIYVRDIRGRNACDTAIRRQHHHLLRFLNSQVQLRVMSMEARRERNDLFTEMRKAYFNNKLFLTRDHAIVQRLIEKTCPDRSSRLLTMYPPNCFQTEDLTAAAQLDPLLKTNVAAATTMEKIISPPQLSPPLAPLQPGYAEWQWPAIIMKCMTMPSGVFELIMDMIPTPRLWKWGLQRLKRRCVLAPHQATIDICILMDEIITDMGLFRTPRQHAHLLRIARNPTIQTSLLHDIELPRELIDALIQWSDVQSLAFRMTDYEVSFKPRLAAKLLAVALNLYRICKADTNISRKFMVYKLLCMYNCIGNRSLSRPTTTPNDVVDVDEFMHFDDDGLPLNMDELFDQDTENEMAGEADMEEVAMMDEFDLET